MQLINPHGIEVTVDAAGWDAIEKRGDADRFKRIPVCTPGDGPKEKIILLLYGNGIGDMVHSMPAIYQKLREGFDITVLCETPLAPFYARLGDGSSTMKVRAIPTDVGMLGFIPEHRSEYGAFYSLRHWCIAHDEESRGAPTIDRFEQFAGYIGTTLPEAFDWKPYLLGPDIDESGIANRVSDFPSVLLGMQASSRQREYPNAIGLKTALAARRIAWNEIGRREWYSRQYPDAQEREIVTIPFEIACATAVVAVDSGILAMALALGKPVVALMGPTEEKIIVQQFKRYLPDAKVTVIRSAHRDNKCQRPCNFMGDRGYGVRGKCTRIPEADCMKEIMPDTVIEALDTLLTSN